MFLIGLMENLIDQIKADMSAGDNSRIRAEVIRRMMEGLSDELDRILAKPEQEGAVYETLQ